MIIYSKGPYIFNANLKERLAMNESKKANVKTWARAR